LISKCSAVPCYFLIAPFKLHCPAVTTVTLEVRLYYINSVCERFGDSRMNNELSL